MRQGPCCKIWSWLRLQMRARSWVYFLAGLPEAARTPLSPRCMQRQSYACHVSLTSDKCPILLLSATTASAEHSCRAGVLLSDCSALDPSEVVHSTVMQHDGPRYIRNALHRDRTTLSSTATAHAAFISPAAHLQFLVLQQLSAQQSANAVRTGSLQRARCMPAQQELPTWQHMSQDMSALTRMPCPQSWKRLMQKAASRGDLHLLEALASILLITYSNSTK